MAPEHDEDQQTNDTNSSQTRRSALKKMLVGTGVAAGAATLPGKWTKPLVDKVLVPAHAQTSTTTTTTAEPLPTSFNGPVSLEIQFAKSAKMGLIETLAGKILPVAHANPAVSVEGDLCITLTNDTKFEAKLLFSYGEPNGDAMMISAVPSDCSETYEYYFEGSGEVGKAATHLALKIEPCCGKNQFGQVQIAVAEITAIGADWAITGGLSGSALPLLPVKEGCPEKPIGCEPEL